MPETPNWKTGETPLTPEAQAHRLSVQAQKQAEEDPALAISTLDLAIGVLQSDEIAYHQKKEEVVGLYLYKAELQSGLAAFEAQIDSYQKALKLLDDPKHPLATDLHVKIGQALRELLDTPQAIVNPQDTAEHLMHTGIILEGSGKLDESSKCQATASMVFQELANERGVYFTSLAQGRLLIAKGDYMGARASFSIAERHAASNRRKRELGVHRFYLQLVVIDSSAPRDPIKAHIYRYSMHETLKTLEEDREDSSEVDLSMVDVLLYQARSILNNYAPPLSKTSKPL